MKSIALYSSAILGSIFWLWTNHQHLNPIILRGPDFLNFYIILLSGTYLSLIFGTWLKISNSKTDFSFLILVFSLGIVKLFRGIYLDKPVGYLVMILFAESIVFVIITITHLNKKLK